MRTDGPTPDLSIIIPAYNEERRIVPTLARISTWLEEEDIHGEIVVVDDGSVDDTAGVVASAAKEFPVVRLVRNGRNRGKGYTVRNGVLEARGRYILFSDADLSTPIEEFMLFRPLLADGTDVVIGSRRMGGAQIEIPQPALRRLMGRVFNLLVRAVAVPDVRDSQCGFKCFSRDAARAVFRLQRIEGFAFDVEVLFLASRLGFSMREVPVRWLDDRDSKVSRLWDPAKMFFDLLRIRANELSGLYDRSVLYEEK
jgi:dolichyl-phosphate beta-glucosyltransferase